MNNIISFNLSTPDDIAKQIAAFCAIDDPDKRQYVSGQGAAVQW